MYYDLNLIRDILRALAAYPGPDFLDVAIPGLPDALVSNHIKLMVRIGLIEAVNSKDCRHWRAVRLTCTGQAMLDAAC